ncbi:MAG: hypothetical protein ABEK50_09575 [bacterium]
MTDNFVAEMKQTHADFLELFEEYRNKLTEVLFYGERISRSELQEGKDTFLNGLRRHIETVQQILLPAVTPSDSSGDVVAIDLFADFQDRLEKQASQTEDTEENIEFFANPDAPKDERNDAARETLKDLYRLDSLLSTYFQLIENHFLTAGSEQLDDDEKQQLLEELRVVRPD